MSELSNEELEQAIRNATDEELMELEQVGPHTVTAIRKQLTGSVWSDVE